MKKYRIVILFVLCLVAGFLYLQFGRDVNVVSSMNSSSEDYYEMDLTIVANRLIIIDKNKFAENLKNRCMENNFREIKFSYDILGYPDRIKIKVYPNELSRQICRESFTVCYEIECRSYEKLVIRSMHMRIRK
ncbi:hypothetical protein B5F13_00585 [Drancourtella sp. An177]|nr:hypothetical protein B5F13_00585 [Drancourtella sp. An177]